MNSMSIWQKTSRLPSFESLRENIKTQVLVIGGGLAGILTAHFLKESGVDCVILEKGRVCGGTTSGTTAKLTFQHGLIYSRLLKEKGEYAAREYQNANAEALEHFAKLCADKDCDYEIRPSCVYSLRGKKLLVDEIEALDRIGVSAKFEKELPLPFETDGGVTVENQAQINPLKLAAELLNGLTVYENSPVCRFEKGKAVTDNGSVTADYIVISTHFPFINSHGAYFLKLYQNRSYMAALKNAKSVGGMYVDENEKGMTFRDYGEYLIIGSGGSRTGKDMRGGERLDLLTREYYPGAQTVCRWAAQDCMSLDGMPYIGRYSAAAADMFVATGFNKWGMTGSMLSAMIISDMILKRQNRYERLFSPSRSMFKKQLFVNGLESAVNMLRPTAPRCPHLGCALKWNASEHSWDCSCHGSRFASDGEILNNPANKPLGR